MNLKNKEAVRRLKLYRRLAFNITGIIVILLSAVCILCGCSEKNDNGTVTGDDVNTSNKAVLEGEDLKYNLDNVIAAVSKFSDMSDIDYVKKDDDTDNELLIYTIGIEETKIIEKISDYIIGASSDRSNSSFAVFIFESDTDENLITETINSVKQYYVDRLISLAKVYSPEEAEKAENAEFIKRDNRLYLVISNDNKDDIVNEAEKVIK